MSISQTLSNAVSGLTAAARMAEVTSANLANVMTEGYGRRSLTLSAATVGGRGAGVQIDGVERYVDRAVLTDRRLAEADYRGMSDRLDMARRIEALIGIEGQSGGLTDRFTALDQALIGAAGDPSSDQRLALVLSQFQSVASGLNEASAGIQSLRVECDGAISAQVGMLNTALKDVERLNVDIAKAQGSGDGAVALIDQRQKLVDQISGIVPLREIDRQNGQIALITNAGQTLLDGVAAQFEFTPTHTITPDMTLQSGALGRIGLRGQPLAGTSGAGSLTGGTLGAAFELRDQVLVDAQTGLDDLAFDVAARLQATSADPSLAPGSAGILTDAGNAVDTANRDGLAARLRVNAMVDPASGGNLRLLRDGLGAAAGPPGDATQLDRLRETLSAPIAGVSGAADSAAGLAARFVAKNGAARLTVEDRMAFSAARWNALRQTELAGGVDTDQEMQMLMRIEQAYAANAKVVQVVDSMLRTLTEI